MNGTPYHKSCFKCTHGGCVISPSNYIAHEGRLYCKHHHNQLIKEKGNLSQLEGENGKTPIDEKVQIRQFATETWVVSLSVSISSMIFTVSSKWYVLVIRNLSDDFVSPHIFRLVYFICCQSHLFVLMIPWSKSLIINCSGSGSNGVAVSLSSTAIASIQMKTRTRGDTRRSSSFILEQFVWQW